MPQAQVRQANRTFPSQLGLRISFDAGGCWKIEDAQEVLPELAGNFGRSFRD